MQNACEPVHIQLNPIDLKVLAINRTYKKMHRIDRNSRIFGSDSKSLFHEGKKIDLAETEVIETGFVIISALANTSGVVFVVLNLKTAPGKIISHNVILDIKDDYKSLNELQNKVDVRSYVR